MTIQTVQRKGRASIRKIEALNVRKKQGLTKAVYGVLMICVSITVLLVDPVSIATNYALRMEEGSFMYEMWAAPSYQLTAHVYMFNYTNVDQFLRHEHATLQLQEIGPFVFREIRRNLNMSLDKEAGLLRMRPDTRLEFLRDRSVGDPNTMRIIAPNLALIALSTLAADQLGAMSNMAAGVLMRSTSPNLFLNVSVHEYMWGYRDPLVSVANTILPGWIDFGYLGLMDRFYAQVDEEVVVDISDTKTKYSIKEWAGSPGLKQQAYTDWNASIPCNRVKGSYEGLMLTPNFGRDRLVPLYRKQACRVYPFQFHSEGTIKEGVSFDRYKLQQSAFNSSSEFACNCKGKCLPDGFVDISECFYGFPIALTKPHMLDADSTYARHYEGLRPDPAKHDSYIDIVPSLGVPVSLYSSVQANIAVRTSAFNPITRPIDGKILPLFWLSMFCLEPPAEVASLLKMRFVIAPPIVITLEVLLFLGGTALLAHGIYRFLVPLDSTRMRGRWPNDMPDSNRDRDVTEEDNPKENEALLTVIECNLSNIPRNL